MALSETIYITLLILKMVTVVRSFLFANQCAAPTPCYCEFLYDITTSLYCNNTQLHAIPAFKTISIDYTAVEIRLNHNKLTSIHALAFKVIASAHASKIEIDLQYNQISQIDIDAFNGIVAHVKRIDLQNNRLTHLPRAFSKLTSLNELNLLNNPLTNLDGVILKTFGQSLTRFSFSVEHFVRFPTELTVLHFPFNLLIDGIPFHTIPADTFYQGMPLYKLEINHSKLDHIPDAVCNLTYLVILSFTSSTNLKNTSTSLLDQCQKSMNEVTTLSLYGNQLHSMPNITDWFPELMSLNLSKNHLQQISPNYSLPLKVTELDLSYNQFTKIPRVLHKQPLLYHLYMSGNQITSIDDKDLEGFHNLRTLKLNDNPIWLISPNAFTRNSFLSKIELKNVKLVQIPEALMKMGSLDLVDFSGSPINCSCNAMSYLRNWDVRSLFIAGECYHGHGSRIYDYVKYDIHSLCP